MIGFNGLTENLPLAQQVILADKFVQRPGSHPVRKGSLPLEQFFLLLLKKFRLLLQKFSLLFSLDPYALCSVRYALFCISLIAWSISS